MIHYSSQRPKVIFFDGVGTLFGVKGSVGEIYAQIARQFGLDADAQAVNQAFFQSFREAPPLAFPDVDITTVPNREFAWWKAIAQQTFQKTGDYEQFSRFSEFFDALYDHFATAAPWFVYDDVYDSLRHWREEGIPLGIISNFDSRIHRVLPALGLVDYFSSVTISTEVGAAKPNAQVFEMALKKHSCPSNEAWHIGDSFREDYEGAKAVGMRAIWLKR